MLGFGGGSGVLIQSWRIETAVFLLKLRFVVQVNSKGYGSGNEVAMFSR